MKTRILFLFFASGFSGLIYEIVWTKLFSHTFGNTIYAVSTVLAAFMLGLAAGSFIFGIVADKIGRDLKLFAYLEWGVGISALGIVLFYPLMDSFYVSVHHHFSLSPEGSTLLRFLTSFLILLVPTTLMGGTLPVLSRCLIGRLTLTGREISRLYGINTLGACVGCFLAGYLFISSLGTTLTQLLAVTISVSVGFLAYSSRNEFADFLSSETPDNEKPTKKKAKKTGPKDSAPSEEESATNQMGFQLLFFSCVAGFCGLAYEVLWTRAFSIIFKSTVYLFSNILTVFLLGIAIGSLCYKKFLENRDFPLRTFGILQLAIGCYALFTILIFLWLPGEVGAEGQWVGAASWGNHIISLFYRNLLIVIIPACLMGISFPLISKAYISSMQAVGEGAGRVYGINLVGGIFGSIAAGFLLIPWTGLQTGILFVAVINMAAGSMAIIKSGSRQGFGWIGGALVLASMIFISTALVQENDIGTGSNMGGEIIYKKEGAAGTVKVIKEKGGKALTLSVNNYLLATTGDVAVRFGHIPLLFHPYPKNVLTISLGAGITSGAVGNHREVERIDCVEIVPELVEAAAFFQESNSKILSHPKFHLTVWDGRNFVRTVRRKYDVIISDLFQPDSSGIGNLYSKEHYENCLVKLNPHGLMAQWLPLYQLHPDDLKTIMATFSSVFPKTTVWYGDINSSKPTLMLLGSREDLRLNPGELAKKMKANPSIQKDLIEWNDPYSLLSFFIMDQDGMAEMIKETKINSDAHPVIEYSAPKHVWSRLSDTVLNFTELSHFRSVFHLLDPAIPGEERLQIQEKLKAYFESRTRLLKGRIAHASSDIRKEVEFYKSAEAVNPSDPYLGFSYFELGHLYLQQRRSKEALWFLEKATSISPYLPEAHYFLSTLYKQMGETEKADREYRLAVEMLK